MDLSGWQLGLPHPGQVTDTSSSLQLFDRIQYTIWIGSALPCLDDALNRMEHKPLGPGRGNMPGA